MKKIGFVDYFISEWHANNYPAWIDAASKRLGLDMKVCYAWAEDDVSPVDGVTTDEWCEKFGTERCASIEELCEKSDYIVILSPSNAEKHLGYAEKVLKYGKPTYIDKTFSPDYATAERIFEIANEYGTPFFSTSALRYATELDSVNPVKTLDVTGGGRLFEEYCIHQIEMIVKLMNAPHTSVTARSTEDTVTAEIGFADGRTATVNFASDNPFTVKADGGEVVPISSDFFGILIADMLRFFDTKEVSFDTAQTLQAMDIREKMLSQL